MKLYFAPKTRASRPLWLLEELGAPYELVKLDMKKGEHKSPEYLSIHPHGVVPALVDEGHVFIESVAICLYLTDKFADKGLAPPPGCLERGHYYQWCAYVIGTMETSIVAGAQAFPDVVRVLNGALEGREFLVGGKFTTADLLVGSALIWAKFMGLIEGQPVLEAYTNRLTARPAYQRMRAA